MYKFSESVRSMDWIRPRVLPSLKEQQIVCASDYSGGQKDSDFHVLSSILVSQRSTSLWERQIKQLRRDTLGDRSMSFKALNDGIRLRSLDRFLYAASRLEGLLVVVEIEKRLGKLFSTDLEMGQFLQHTTESGVWDKDSLERACRITFFNALFICGLCSPHEGILWVTDEDSIIATPDRHTRLSWLAGVLCQVLSNSDEGHVFTTTDATEDWTDLTAVPDLAAGAMASFGTLQFAAGGATPPAIGSTKSLTTVEKEKVRRILEWMAPHGNLRKLRITLYAAPDAESLYEVRFGLFLDREARLSSSVAAKLRSDRLLLGQPSLSSRLAQPSFQYLIDAEKLWGKKRERRGVRGKKWCQDELFE